MMMRKKDLMREKLVEFYDSQSYIFITVCHNNDSRPFFYNGTIKKISDQDIIFLDDKLGEISISIDVVKTAIPKGGAEK